MIVNMAMSFRFIFWIPVVIFLILNLLFKLWIWVLQQVGSASVWCNRQFIKAGNYFTHLAEDDEKVDAFIDKIAAMNKKRGKRQ